METIIEIIKGLRHFSKSPEFQNYSESYRVGYEECLDDLEWELGIDLSNEEE